MSSIDNVRFYFYPQVKRKDPDHPAKLMAFVYNAVIEQGINPNAILIRSDWHSTKSSIWAYGHQRDPKGGHYTFSCKDARGLAEHTHITFHAYTPSPASFVLTQLEKFGIRKDSAMRSNGMPVWPADSELLEVDPAEYRHLMGEITQENAYEDGEEDEEEDREPKEDKEEDEDEGREDN